MSQWKNDDSAANSVLWGVVGYNKTGNSSNRDTFYGNTTADGYVTGLTVGQFGVDPTEMAVTNGSIVGFTLTFAGSGYFSNATVTVEGNGTANAFANVTTGKIQEVKVVASGNSYSTSPAVSIAAPAAQTFNANSALFVTATFNGNTDVANTTDFVAITSNPFVNGDALLYTVDAGNTAIGGLANGTTYYVVSGNSTGVKLANASGGSALDITSAVGADESGHNLRRTGFLEIGSNVFQDGDYVTYTVSAGNTALTGLTSGNKYYVINSNTSGLRLSATRGGTAITLVPGLSETGHSLTGETATASAVVSGASGKGFHAGWVVRKVGTGGRAGRVQYETLVAMGSMTGDGSDDTIFKDA